MQIATSNNPLKKDKSSIMKISTDRFRLLIVKMQRLNDLMIKVCYAKSQDHGLSDMISTLQPRSRSVLNVAKSQKVFYFGSTLPIRYSRQCLSHFLGDWSQSEKQSEIKPPLENYKFFKSNITYSAFVK
jgi:hypothetical protein